MMNMSPHHGVYIICTIQVRDSMPTLSNASVANGLFTMFKGEPGTRKSTQALSYPKPQYWISTDQKMESLILPAMKWGYDITSSSVLEYDDYKNWSGPRQKLKLFETNCKFKTVIVDSITSIGDAMNSETMKQKGENVYKIGSIPVSTIEDYKAEASGFQELISMLKDIQKFHKIHIIIIAHVVGQRSNNDANKLTHHSRVIVTGGDKISAKVSAYCTEAYHFNIKPAAAESQSGDYACITSHTGNDYARTSLELPREIVFNDKPLYDTWIRPAIEKMTPKQQQVRPTDKPSFT